MLLISEDGQGILQANPRGPQSASRDAAGTQIFYELSTFPPRGRYKLFARLQQDAQMILTDFTVDLP